MIKSLNLTKEIDKDVKPGLNNIDYEGLNKVTNNYVQHIDCLCLDEFSFEERNKVLVECIKKLSIGGTLNLKFVNMDLLANKIKKCEITGQKYSQILSKTQSCWSELETQDVISQTKMLVKTIHHENIYSIITLEKNQ